MTQRDEPWPPGTPCWVDVMSPDIGVSRAFYAGLFGWQMLDSPPEFGGYTMALVDGRAVAALSPMPPGYDLPIAWSTYLATDDADATVQAVEAHGGKITVPPVDVPTVGRFAVATDPSGATFGVWQAGGHNGFALANVANTCSWNEYLTADYDAARDFYSAVFGVTFTEIGDGSFQYSTMHVDGEVVGGLGARPAGEPARWDTYFTCDDTDGTVARALELGGRVARPAADTPFGRIALLADPGGATFDVIELGSMPSAST